MTHLEWRTVVSPIFAQNAFVVRRAGDSRCVVVDPGLDTDTLFELIASEQWEPAAIFNTHGHADHIAGNGAAKEQWPEIPLLIGHGDAGMLTDPTANLSAMFGIGLTSPEADQLLREGEQIEFGGLRWDILETPGHSPGHIVFICKDVEPWLVLGGDMLFREGIGRTDFPGGNPVEMGTSIREKLFKLPDDAVVLPGHGEATTIGHEKENNPFVGML